MEGWGGEPTPEVCHSPTNQVRLATRTMVRIESQVFRGCTVMTHHSLLVRPAVNSKDEVTVPPSLQYFAVQKHREDGAMVECHL